MAKRGLLTRREFVKTLAVGAGIAGAGAAALSAVMKAAGSGRRLGFRGVGRRNLPAGKDYCRLCEKCLPWPQGVNTRSIQTCPFSLRKQGQAEKARRLCVNLVAQEKANRCIECSICEASCPLGGSYGRK